MKNLLQTSLCMAAILMPFSLLAQDSDGIEDVIVTATRRETSIMETPLAISAVTQEELTRSFLSIRMQTLFFRIYMCVFFTWDQKSGFRMFGDFANFHSAFPNFLRFY